jgi:hypothetical protein
VVPNEESGYPESIELDATDESGRSVHATGTCVNQLRMATVPGVPFPFWACGTNWVVNDEPAWGQDQTVPIGRRVPHIGEARAPIGRWP